MQYALEHSHTQQAIKARLARGPHSNYLRDWIYGGIDGAVTTFAIIAGVAGADLAAGVVLILGFANLLADGLAMAASNYSGTTAERDDYKRVLGIEQKHIALVPEGEREEIRQIFSAKGFSGDDLKRIVSVITSDKALWVKTMAVEEYGLSPTPRSPALAALSTFAAFILCGLVPLAAFLLAGGLMSCVVAAGATFFGVGRRRRHQKQMVADDLVEVRPRDLADRHERSRRRFCRRLLPQGPDFGLTWIKPACAGMRFISVCGCPAVSVAHDRALASGHNHGPQRSDLHAPCGARIHHRTDKRKRNSRTHRRGRSSAERGERAALLVLRRPRQSRARDNIAGSKSAYGENDAGRTHVASFQRGIERSEFRRFLSRASANRDFHRG